MNKFLIVGIGNIGKEYVETRHNIGFKALDWICKEFGGNFETKKLGDISKTNYKGKTFILLKPSTYVNLSGKSIRYWLSKEKIRPENLLVISDDLNLDFGAIRIRTNGSDGGHNGLKSIDNSLGSNEYPRLRFGIGSEFIKGNQSNYVLENFSKSELENIDEQIQESLKIIEGFCFEGIEQTMNKFN